VACAVLALVRFRSRDAAGGINGEIAACNDHADFTGVHSSQACRFLQKRTLFKSAARASQ
jgi:hypothetical protein